MNPLDPLAVAATGGRVVIAEESEVRIATLSTGQMASCYGYGVGFVKVFLSYRRGDDPFAVGRLRDALAASIGDHNVFLDVLSISSGDDFHKVIDETIAASDVVLVVMGPRWEEASADRSAIDYVELEVGVALAQGKRVIPVLVGTRPMPDESTLPGSLKSLATINAHRLRPDPDFRADAARLLGLIGTSSTRSAQWRSLRPLLLSVAVSLVAVASVVVTVVQSRSDDAMSGESIPSSSSSVVGTTSIVAASSTSGATTTTALPLDDLYPEAPAQARELYADNLDVFPDLPVLVTGYWPGRGEFDDTVRVAAGEPASVPPVFSTWSKWGVDCDQVWWVAVWKSSEPDALVHAELAPSDILLPGVPTVAPAKAASRAGYLSGDGCHVMALWFEPEGSGSGVTYADVWFQWQVYDLKPVKECKPYTPNEAVPLAVCQKGENIKLVQQLLVDLQLVTIEVDGEFGPATETAVKAFQKIHHLPMDGTVNTATWREMFPALPVPLG